jgi:hypothetical protein
MISAIVVSYRSAALATRAIESLREEAASSGLSVEVVAVVNSGDPAERVALEAVADVVVDPGRNLGYAGGLNLGASAARGGTLLFANPDLVFRAGSLPPLLEALETPEKVAAGPAFFLDEGETLLIPPFDEPHPLELARRRLALDPEAAGALFRREVRRILRAFGAAIGGRTIDACALSGALFATRRSTFESVGPFDEEFRLYYEENDWQRRLRTAGGRLRYVGGSRVIHVYNQSARQEPRAAGWFAESERRYFRAHFGERGEKALAALAGAPSRTWPLPPPLGERALCLAGGAPAAVALSPLPCFRPIVLSMPGPSHAAWRPPLDFLRAIGGTAWFARSFDLATGRVLDEASISEGAP